LDGWGDFACGGGADEGAVPLSTVELLAAGLSQNSESKSSSMEGVPEPLTAGASTGSEGVNAPFELGEVIVPPQRGQMNDCPA